MRFSHIQRRLLAVSLCAALLFLVSPVLTTGGGCDDPGGITTCSNNNRAHSGQTGQPHSPTPHSLSPRTPVAGSHDVSVWRRLLLTLIIRFIA
ncbi:MAG: hypothetical protein HY049_13295 [Acidobacteria bacterium]|nr:hypothetical protein [Acidobacteriota bacterium]